MTARIIRPLRGRIRVKNLRAPGNRQPTNKEMYRTAASAVIRPTWVEDPSGEPGWRGCSSIARQHLTDVAEAAAIRDGLVLIEMHYSVVEQCDMRCQIAEGSDCMRSCEGKDHGKGEHAA